VELLLAASQRVVAWKQSTCLMPLVSSFFFNQIVWWNDILALACLLYTLSVKKNATGCVLVNFFFKKNDQFYRNINNIYIMK
jgi:hypothetical protein